MMQRYMPLIFAVIYINIAAGVNIYFIVSSMCRIGIQEAIFRSGTLDRPAPAGEGVLPSSGGKATAPRRRTMMERLADLQRQALEQKEAQEQAKRGLTAGEGNPSGTAKPSALPAGEQKGSSSNGAPKKPSSGTSKNQGRPPGVGATDGPKADGQGAGPNAKNTNGTKSNGSGDKKPTHPRSKTKRDRKDR
jgi:hypothetical protein